MLVELSYREKLMLLANTEAAVKAWETRKANGWTPKEREEKQRRVPASKPETKASGRKVREMREPTAKELAALKGIVPPAGTNVLVPVESDTGLLATWVDEKGRTQPRYSAEHSAKKNAEKFSRVKEFNKALPDIRKTIEADMKNGDEAASVLYVIDKTGFRPGGDSDTGGDVKAYGASTLKAEHVKVDGNSVSFSFTGKSGVTIEKTVEDAKLAKMIGKRAAAGGDLFPNVNEGSMRKYLKETAGDFKVKDFRTWHGTAQAIKAMKGMPKPKTDAQFKKAQREVWPMMAEWLERQEE